MKNKVRPTEKQLKTLQHLKTAKSLQEAMLAGGYSSVTSSHPKQNFIAREGTKILIDQYRTDLINAGVSSEILAEIEVAGLFEENGAVRLGYLKEVKKSFGLSEPDQPANQTNIQIIVTRGE